MKTIFASVAIATLAMAIAPAAEAANTRHATRHPASQMTATQPKERLGTLSCEVAGGVGMLIGSSRSVTCDFKQRTGKVERYTGSIGKLGLDVGVTGKSYIRWIVYNVRPTTTGQGALAGTYVGASARASVGVGLGGNALVGGSNKNFGLQPLSAETGTGLNVAAGVSRLQLRAAR
ncbi:DUF992 domain-containing protein [Allorhizobium taibaishanense]|uniref:DUF992 domain-containing protein n=1 Tax=Allorhizobium taibaishanense TaxID=887144 RepID=A0A1Q9A5M2_9HYPH|nr:DUF992 domain-containing protein [Allorhizobium taibaishanense]MBB4006453.1 hypothetical protein [Allorhizobium taibaishanense]OLP49876.1 hypothetical protein BJF91_20335 [Allorhizobium taibaishanense]